MRKEKLASKKTWSIIDSFTNKDIEYMDDSLEADTIIQYREYHDTYDNLRQNVVKAFEDNYYTMSKDDMYIDTKLDKIGEIDTIRLIGWREFDGESIEFNITVEYIANWNGTKVTKISSDDELFGKIFFDK